MTLQRVKITGFYGTEKTAHYSNDRANRENAINQIGMGEVVDSFIVDRQHKNGLEIHQITTTGIVVIFSMNSGRLVTKLIARAAQVERYYIGENAPASVVKLAAEHERKGYNLL